MIISDAINSFVELEERFSNFTAIKTCKDALHRAKLGSVPEIRVAPRRS